VNKKNLKQNYDVSVSVVFTTSA